ncbi:MAG TPA: LacI family DNA-binding transcriptional regulator [Microlunatus sp.]|nr:LacI family DNA-binding transcriptional regulator [Microlunatus sp.]
MPVQEATTVAGSDEMDTESTIPRSRISGAPTLELVAAESGVSRSTVSRVVNGSPKVRPEVVEAVNAAIARLNYVPNRAARSLASRQTYAIALLVPERVMTFFNDPFFASVVQGITERMEDSDYILNLLVSSSDPSRKTRRYLRGGNVDGAFVISHHAADRDLADLCDIMPVVFGGRPALADLASCHYVDIDNVHGARTAVEHLAGSGRRRIATITGPGDMLAAVDRRSGWQDGLRAAGLPADALAVGDFTELGGAAAMRALLADWPDLDAVFVANDLMARGALHVLADAGRSVPGDVAVVGYDDSPTATSLQPQLSTVSQPSELMGRRMTELLLALLAGEEPPELDLLPTTLVARQTS